MLRLRDPQPGSREIGYVARALEHERLVVVPTDTVYGIAALAASEPACQVLAEAKGRDAIQPTAVIFAGVEPLIETLTGLSVRAIQAIYALLPGPYTLIVRDASGFAPHLRGATLDRIGVRVPDGAFDLPPIAATSANLHGESEPLIVEELAPALLERVEVVVDCGPRTEAPSTVLDLTDWETGGDVRVLRDTPGRAPTALAKLA